MKKDAFAKVAESLRQYRRAELKEFEAEIGTTPIDQLYVDPLPANAILNSVLSSNTTFILGRKGTGKSTVFAKAQSVLRKRKNIISIYIDVKSLYEITSNTEVPDQNLAEYGISAATYRAHMLRKGMLGSVISELLKEVNSICSNLTFIDRWRGEKRQLEDLRASLVGLGEKVKFAKLDKSEIPVLQRISRQLRTKQQRELSSTTTGKSSASVKLSIKDPELSLGGEETLSDFDKTLDDMDVYDEYSDVVYKSFPFSEILKEIQDLLSESGLLRLVVFFDDFSELRLLDQRLFVDVVLSPLNNSSNDAIKLKVAGYPGRVYYGRIDPSKTDTINLDFCELYEALEIQEMERSATDYCSRLLIARFKAFGLDVFDFFDISQSSSSGFDSIDDCMKLMFEASFNVPRIMGHLLHQCYIDRISKSQKINSASLRLSARKYYEGTISKYFDLFNRYALEPFENKLDRHNQKILLEHLIKESKVVRRKIIDGNVGGSYFQDLANPPVSHFIVKSELGGIFSSLESNFFITRYKNTRDKDGEAAIVYALFLGLAESERLAWGYPEGRQYRNYFVQRCFDYTRAVRDYLSSSQTIKCGSCGQCYPIDNKSKIEFYKWRCPECNEGLCSVVSLSDDFRDEVDALDREIMLEPIELEIVTTLHGEDREMRAGEVAVLIDTTHQLIGRRTSKLQDMGLVTKCRDEDGKMRSSITERCERTYF